MVWVKRVGGRLGDEGEGERQRTQIGIKTSKREKKAAVVREVSLHLDSKGRELPETLLQYLFVLQQLRHACTFAEVTYNIAYFFSSH